LGSLTCFGKSAIELLFGKLPLPLELLPGELALSLKANFAQSFLAAQLGSTSGQPSEEFLLGGYPGSQYLLNTRTKGSTSPQATDSTSLFKKLPGSLLLCPSPSSLYGLEYAGAELLWQDFPKGNV